MNITKHFVNRRWKCFSFFVPQEKNMENNLATVIYASLIPLIIRANFLSIIGILKTKRNKFTSSQILFLALFLSDLIIGTVQLPLQIYLVWAPDSPTCLEIYLTQVLIVFPIAMSGNILCVIPIDRYIQIACGRRHERIVTNRLLAITITLMIVISFTWAASVALFYVNLVFLVLIVCEGILFLLGVWFNFAILMNVKLRTINPFTQHTRLNKKLTKTISLIVAMMFIAYVPLLVHIYISPYVLQNWTNLHSIIKVVVNLRWTIIPSQLNAVLNSVIYVIRNSRMKRYYCNSLKCISNKD